MPESSLSAIFRWSGTCKTGSFRPSPVGGGGEVARCGRSSRWWWGVRWKRPAAAPWRVTTRCIGLGRGRAGGRSAGRRSGGWRLDQFCVGRWRRILLRRGKLELWRPIRQFGSQIWVSTVGDSLITHIYITCASILVLLYTSGIYTNTGHGYSSLLIPVE
jgi:hypothetical protein